MLCVGVPRSAYDLCAQTRVRAQTVPRPQRLPVRADLALRRVTRSPVRVQRAREGVPVCRNITPASLGELYLTHHPSPPIIDLSVSFIFTSYPGQVYVRDMCYPCFREGRRGESVNE